jgi:5-methylcytosine-specific restriction endonuclease McrA
MIFVILVVQVVLVVIDKICLTCKVSKPITEFNLRGKNRPGEYQASCKPCCYEVSNKNKRHISSLVKRWKLRKGCQRCGFKAEHSCQLDIDHIIPKGKNGNDRQAINTSWSKLRLKEELSKCQVLCANCHRLKTFEDGTMFQSKI